MWCCVDVVGEGLGDPRVYKGQNVCRHIVKHYMVITSCRRCLPRIMILVCCHSGKIVSNTTRLSTTDVYGRVCVCWAAAAGCQRGQTMCPVAAQPFQRPPPATHRTDTRTLVRLCVLTVVTARQQLYGIIFRNDSPSVRYWRVCVCFGFGKSLTRFRAIVCVREHISRPQLAANVYALVCACDCVGWKWKK